MKRSRLRPTYAIACVAALALTAAPVRATTAARPAAALQRAADLIRTAQSGREVSEPLGTLRDAGDAAFPLLLALAEDDTLHPEVRFYVITEALRNPAPGAVDLAGRLISSADQDLRRRAAKLLQEHADGRVAAALLAQIPKESVPEILAMELYAAGRLGARAEPVLARYLDPKQPLEVQHGAAQGLALAGAAGQAPQILALIRPESESWFVEDLLTAASRAIGQPGLEKLLVWAADPGSPLRLLALGELAHQARDPKDPGLAERLGRIRAAAETGFDDPSPMARRHALIAYTRAAATPFGYLVDPAMLQKVLDMTRDPAPVVRIGTLEALHSTVMRRGLSAPSMPATPLPPETMRILRWPSDWATLPRYVELLDDPDPKVRERTAWMLGIATGYWYGFGDIRLEGVPNLNAEAKGGYREMVEQMSGKTAAEHIVFKLDHAVQAMVKRQHPELHGAWMTAVRLLTARNFGFKANAPVADRDQAIAALASWWEVNRSKHPAEWIIDSLKEGGLKQVNDYNLSLLGRWSKSGLPLEAVDPVKRRSEPDLVVKRILAWWDASKSELQSASLSR